MHTSSPVQSVSSSGTARGATVISHVSAVHVDEEEEHALGPKKLKYKRNDITFAPTVGRTTEAVPLRFFSAPTYNNDKEKVLAVGGAEHSGGGASGRRRGTNLRSQSVGNGLLKSHVRRAEVKDALAFCHQLSATTLTDGQTEDIVNPYAIPQYTIESLVDAICARLKDTAGRLAWNVPLPRPEWCDDLRFFGDWWMCLSDPASARHRAVQDALRVDAAAEQAVYRPLLDAQTRTDEAEEQLIADLALRLQGHLYHFAVLHVDSIRLTPDRLQVLLFDGLVKRRRAAGGKRRPSPPSLSDDHHSEGTRHVAFAPAGAVSKAAQGLPADAAEDVLTVLSLSLCHITTAGVLVVFCALAHLVSVKPAITTLDLSFNALTYRSLSCVTRLLPLTRITCLSLRGNPLASGDPSTLREFLRDGAGTLQELDLGHTRLSYSQVCTVIECLPEMYGLRVLLLDFVDVPHEKASALSKAIIASRLWHVSLHGVAVCASDAYMNPIREACARHRRDALDGTAAINSFFQRFFQQSYANGWRPPTVEALPDGYGVFTNNDPSLHQASGASADDPVWLRDGA